MGKVFYVCSCHCMARDINEAVDFMANRIYNELRITNKDNIAITTVLIGNDLIVIGIDSYGNIRKRKAYGMEYEPTCDNKPFVNMSRFELHPELEYKTYDSSNDDDDDDEDDDEEDDDDDDDEEDE